MKVGVFGRATTFEEAQSGSLLRIAIEKTEYLGMKVFSSENTALLVLQPDLPQFGGRPAIITGSHFDSFTVCEVMDAEIRASYEHLELVHPISCEAGDLALAEGRTFICVRIRSEQAYVDPVTGEYGALSNVPMAIKQWSIVRVVDGKATAPIFRRSAAS